MKIPKGVKQVNKKVLQNKKTEKIGIMEKQKPNFFVARKKSSSFAYIPTTYIHNANYLTFFFVPLLQTCSNFKTVLVEQIFIICERRKKQMRSIELESSPA